MCGVFFWGGYNNLYIVCNCFFLYIYFVERGGGGRKEIIIYSGIKREREREREL
ncbi:hypothetical protein BD770DRAFT_384084 [Pilaira anomala]|nr:hypothetical protein BD770DRAFT_384084 [Pilaira anomala]